jgi:hydrogenase nickel incorporation protein HypA/HybF
MHELSITQSVVDAVLEKLPDQPIAVVSLEIGTLSGIEPDALRFCFELVTAGTTLQGAELQISRPQGRAHCSSCQADFDLDTCILLCPCGSADVQVRSGGQLLISSVMVA